MVRVNHEKLQKFVSDVFESLEVPPRDANIAARVLVAADLRGVDSHGVVRINPHSFYARDLRDGRINPTPRIEVVQEQPRSTCRQGTPLRPGHGHHHRCRGKTGNRGTPRQEHPGWMGVGRSRKGYQGPASRTESPHARTAREYQGRRKPQGIRARHHGRDPLRGPLRFHRSTQRTKVPGARAFFRRNRCLVVSKEFKADMDRMLHELRSTSPQQGQEQVYVAGDIEFSTAADRAANGIPLHPSIIEDLQIVGKECGVPCDLDS